MYRWKTQCPHFPVQNAHLYPPPRPSPSIHSIVHVPQLVALVQYAFSNRPCFPSSALFTYFMPVMAVWCGLSQCVVHPLGHWPLITENVNSALVLTKHAWYSVLLL